MFYAMIKSKRDEWLRSESCTIKALLRYIEKTGQMRDAQIEAIKTYLFLKIVCQSRPLSELFCRGAFNTLSLEDVELSGKTREYLAAHPEAAALFEYALLKNDKGEQVAPQIEMQIRQAPEAIDYGKFFKETFNKPYTDYLFSLPMGAGKTFLMAAFIYLDLYFAQSEPTNPAFAHNFIIFAPAGLKSSVVPSLRTIQNFNPTWILPEPAASTIKRMISFEVLDQGKTANKSNKAKNPNAQKISNYQPFSDLFGLIAVCNAEKVILDRIEEKEGQINFLEDSDDIKDRQANELRNLLGKLPSLSIFIDEVHHAVDEDKKLREVVTRWSVNHTVNSVIGFSGTPYEKAKSVVITDKLSVSRTEIANIVFYYPLIEGVGNFLKRPIVKIAEVADSSRIIENGVREFLNAYKDTVYGDGTVAKLGIYCGTIEKLEELVYPLVARIATEYGLGSDAILKFHKGDRKKKYPQPADSQMQFDTLDKAFSRIRIILLVQIGKEGWDCRSLTGIILSQEGDCPKNMVLQTSCRCLRQVDKGQPETALIYLNDSNAEKLNDQLMQQHHISLKEFTEKSSASTEIKRYSRMAHLHLPKIDFYQFKVNYETMVAETADPAMAIPSATQKAKCASSIIKTTDMTMETIITEVDDTERGTVQATFNAWLYRIVKGSFGTLTMEQLEAHKPLLHDVFTTVTHERDGVRYYSTRYNHALIEGNIRKAFCDKRTYQSKEELIPEEASLLNINNFTPVVHTDAPSDYYPAQDVVEQIMLHDKGKLKLSPKEQMMLEMAESMGNTVIIDILRSKIASHPNKDRSFHYLPYHTDSSFEQTFLREVLTLPEIDSMGLEVYYNGDRAMTEFKIKCYKRSGQKWIYVGMYTPDFLIIQRKDGKIYKAIIVETKGKIYANDPAFRDKRTFMELEFSKHNNTAFGYERFDYMYLEDTLSEGERIERTHHKICTFFQEVQP